MSRLGIPAAVLLGLVVSALMLPAPLLVAGSDDWVRHDYGDVRLFAGDASGEVLMAGVQFRLVAGWKTYWRMPGESGIPADFDWSGSANVKEVTVGWPAPRRMVDAGGETIGYKGDVVFPVRVTRQDPGKPAILDLKLFFAVCLDICVPASAYFQLPLGTTDASPADAQLIRRFQDLVPAEDDGSAIIAAAPAMSGGKSYLAVTVSPQLAAAGEADIFVEGFDAAYFRKPRAVSPGKYLLPADGIADAGALSGARLRLTWVAGEKSLSRELTVD